MPKIKYRTNYYQWWGGAGGKEARQGSGLRDINYYVQNK